MTAMSVEELKELKERLRYTFERSFEEGYVWNGTDEVYYNEFSIDMAVDNVISVLKETGVLKVNDAHHSEND